MEMNGLLTSYCASGKDQSDQQIWGSILIVNQPVILGETLEYRISHFSLYSESGYSFELRTDHRSSINFDIGPNPGTISIQDANWAFYGTQYELESTGSWGRISDPYEGKFKWENDQTGALFKNIDGCNVGDSTFPNRTKYEILPDIIELVADCMLTDSIFGKFYPVGTLKLINRKAEPKGTIICSID